MNKFNYSGKEGVPNWRALYKCVPHDSVLFLYNMLLFHCLSTSVGVFLLTRLWSENLTGLC